MFEMRDTFDPLTHNIDAKSLNGSTDVDPRLQNAIHGLGVIEIVCENGSGVQRFASAGPLESFSESTPRNLSDSPGTNQY